jgi:hypothetical protein
LFGNVELVDSKETLPLRFIPQTVLERPLCVVLAEVDVDRLGIIGLDERVQTHRGGTVCPYPRRDQAFQGVGAGVASFVPEFGEC